MGLTKAAFEHLSRTQNSTFLLFQLLNSLRQSMLLLCKFVLLLVGISYVNAEVWPTVVATWASDDFKAAVYSGNIYIILKLEKGSVF